MLEFTYQLAISLFAFLIKFLAPFNAKIKLGVEGRKGLLEKLEHSFAALAGNRPVAWFHAASLGEFEQGRPVIEAYRNRYPDHFILITFFSPSGYEIRKDYKVADYICYLPVDTRANARRFIRIVQPRIAFFIKYEFWFNYLRELEKTGTSIVSFSAIFSKNQSFFGPFGGFFQKMLRRYSHIFVQNQESVRLLTEIGISEISMAGDTRFDRVKTIASQARELPEIASFRNQAFCIVAGSVWDADMQVLIPALNALKGKFKAIIAPHEIKREEIEGWRAKLGGTSILYSEMTDGQPESFDYLIIDNIGMLSSLYRYGDAAFIGGSFGAGLHNVLEAATFGLPVVFGNKSYHRFQEAADLIQEGGAFVVRDSNEVKQIVSSWIQDSEKRLEAGKISRNYVLSKIGATERIMRKVEELMG
ncbi:3-deoxy-D-manno-octulosonic acid transferase [Dyadobacter sp. CY323]|uniref:3-deoxy-D-manno-octulosonic acid transferase n=1 Tax=Dyadobacter sp. CY323 TaxID=2907302 RepID=UPI001F268A0F|nr:glycosyltransferase N-terminal domain-containing protein [Dyadobacter sp. CY323]MCE6992264.1 3-deoxy-D-manno-octulosonic acid transferase [Dyadobacter sp. CY323]